MFSLDTLLEQLRQFEATQGITWFQNNNIYDLQALKSVMCLNEEIRQLFHALQLNLTFYILGTNGHTFNEEHAKEMNDLGYKIVRVRDACITEYWATTKVGVLKF